MFIGAETIARSRLKPLINCEAPCCSGADALGVRLTVCKGWRLSAENQSFTMPGIFFSAHLSGSIGPRFWAHLTKNGVHRIEVHPIAVGYGRVSEAKGNLKSRFYVAFGYCLLSLEPPHELGTGAFGLATDSERPGWGWGAFLGGSARQEAVISQRRSRPRAAWSPKCLGGSI